MASTRVKMVIGCAMIGLGLVQAALYLGDADWVPAGLGVLYAALGVAYLWAEVSAPDR